MANLLLMSDDKDAELGSFFDKCVQNVKRHTSFLSNCDIKILPSDKLHTNILLHCYIDGYNNSPFICGAFMHGSESSLICGDKYIVTEEDAPKFKNSIVYFCACHTGKKLLKSIVESGGAFAAIGYNDTFLVQKLFYMESVFSMCATALFKYFFQNNTLEGSINKMKEEYTNEIDKIYLKDPINASFLIADRDAIVFFGDKNLTFKDVFHV